MREVLSHSCVLLQRQWQSTVVGNAQITPDRDLLINFLPPSALACVEHKSDVELKEKNDYLDAFRSSMAIVILFLLGR